MAISNLSAAIFALLLAANGATAAPVSSDEQALSPDVPARQLAALSVFPQQGQFPGETADDYYRYHNSEVGTLIGKIKNAPPWMKLDRRILSETTIRRFNADQQAMIVSVIKDRDGLEKAAEEITQDHFVYWLMYSQHIEIVKRFIQQGVNVNAEGAIFPNATKERPLTVAIRYFNLEAVRLLLKAGAEPNYTTFDYGFDKTPLHIAVRQKNLEMVKLLVESGANINAEAWGDQGGRGETPTQLAKDMAHSEIEEYLRSKGGTVNYGFLARRIGKQTVGVLLTPLLLIISILGGGK